MIIGTKTAAEIVTELVNLEINKIELALNNSVNESCMDDAVVRALLERKATLHTVLEEVDRWGRGFV